MLLEETAGCSCLLYTNRKNIWTCTVYKIRIPISKVLLKKCSIPEKLKRITEKMFLILCIVLYNLPIRRTIGGDTAVNFGFEAFKRGGMPLQVALICEAIS